MISYTEIYRLNIHLFFTQIYIFISPRLNGTNNCGGKNFLIRKKGFPDPYGKIALNFSTKYGKEI